MSAKRSRAALNLLHSTNHHPSDCVVTLAREALKTKDRRPNKNTRITASIANASSPFFRYSCRPSAWVPQTKPWSSL